MYEIGKRKVLQLYSNESGGDNKPQETGERTQHAYLDGHRHSDPSVGWTVHECDVLHKVADRVDVHHPRLHYASCQ